MLIQPPKNQDMPKTYVDQTSHDQVDKIEVAAEEAARAVRSYKNKRG